MITIPDSGARHIGNTFPAGYKDRKPPVPIRSHLRVFGPGTRSLVMFRITSSDSSSTQLQQRAAFRHEVSANIIFFADNITVALQHCYHSSTILPTFHSQMKRYYNKWIKIKIIFICLFTFYILHKLNVENLFTSIMNIVVWEGVWDEEILKLQYWANINVIYSKIHV